MGEITVSWVILRIKQDNMHEYFALGVYYLYIISSAVPGCGACYWRKDRSQVGSGELSQEQQDTRCPSRVGGRHSGGRTLGREIWRPTGFQGSLDYSLLLKQAIQLYSGCPPAALGRASESLLESPPRG